jgi:hypothetical protein
MMTHVWSGNAGWLDPGAHFSGDLGDGGSQFGDGARIFQTGAFDGHDDYYKDPSSIDMQNIGQIAVGNYGAVEIAPAEV